MMNNCITFCLIALVAVIHSIPTPVSDNHHIHNRNETVESNAIENFLHDVIDDDEGGIHPSKRLREVKNIVDGTLHRVKATGATYRQRLRNGQCLVEYEGQLLSESSVVQIRRKLYRVEDCLLERVFHACGPNLLLMLNVVCRVVEKHQTTAAPFLDFRRQTVPTPTYSNNRRLRPRASKTPRVITESCCENLCTISELTRYCHR